VDPGTVGDFLNGKRWPQADSRRRMSTALDWTSTGIDDVVAGRQPIDLDPDPASGSAHGAMHFSGSALGVSVQIEASGVVDAMSEDELRGALTVARHRADRLAETAAGLQNQHAVVASELAQERVNIERYEQRLALLSEQVRVTEGLTVVKEGPPTRASYGLASRQNAEGRVDPGVDAAREMDEAGEEPQDTWTDVEDESQDDGE